MSVELRNPHSILAALKRRPRAVQRLSIPPAGGPVWEEIEALATEHRVKIETVEARAKPLSPNDRGHRMQSLGGATIEDSVPVPLAQLLRKPEDRYGLWLACDSLQDPQNLGTIFRIASFFGVEGIILTTERSVPLTGTVYDVASGGVEDTPFTFVTNLRQALDQVRENEIWILGTSEHAKAKLNAQKGDRHWLAVVGSEEKGMRRLTEESCDVICSVPNMGGMVDSLNVSVATGVAVHWLTETREEIEG